MGREDRDPVPTRTRRKKADPIRCPAMIARFGRKRWVVLVLDSAYSELSGDYEHQYRRICETRDQEDAEHIRDSLFAMAESLSRASPANDPGSADDV